MTPKRPLLLVLPAVSVSLMFGLSSRQDTTDGKEMAPQSSQVCQECHGEIYANWKNALHAMSLDDPIFRASYLEAYFDSKGAAKFDCLPCHAPITNMNGDFDLAKDITREGVSCDFCHSIKAVHPERREKRFEFDLTGKKRGPLANTSSPAHELEASPLFKSSEFCAGCHEYATPDGVAVLGTFSEWQASPYAKEGTMCQDCHMPLVEGKVVDPKIRPSSQKKINLHAISAAHSTEQLRKAATVEIKKVDKDENFVYVEVNVTNTGSGHFIPTGLPSRQLILWVEIKSPTQYFAQKRIYQRVLRDREGNVLQDIPGMFKKASQVSLDTRLKPRETKLESFVFAAPQSKKYSIIARLEYLYVADVLSPTEIRVNMAEDNK